MAGALAGIRVLEFANYVSGPYAGMLLADLGAEIIKIESDKGDPFRGWGRIDYSPTFGSVNRNKKSVALDLKSPEGAAAARALARQSDVVIENFRAGAMDRLGLGYDALAADNPKLIYCSITGFGNTGPYANRPGYDTVGQAMSGLLSLLTDIQNPQADGYFAVGSSRRHGGMQRHSCRAGRARPNRQGPARRHVAARGHDLVLR